jgi:hypothetical protein
MIAMQYSLVLPADYDMAIIGRRIAERGHLTDGLPGLAAQIAPHADLAALRRSESERSSELLANRDVLATVAAFEPTSWSLVRFQLWRGMPEPPADGQVQIYRVGRVSAGCA